MPAFTGTLNANEIYAALFNMIISQEVFADNIAGTNGSFLDANKVEGSLYGDQKIYYSTDILRTYPWGADLEAPNLLALDRPAAPEQQAIILDQFRQIRCSLDAYLSKRAWSTEGVFSQFNSVMLSWISDTKRVYESTLFNVFVGTDKSSIGGQNPTVPLSSITATGEEEINRLTAQYIGQAVADLFVAMGDPSRSFNDYGQMRSYDEDQIVVVWNADWLNKITKLDLPTIFHNDEIIKKLDGYKLPGKYFGDVYASAGTSIAGDRAVVEADYTVGGVTTHVFPGEELPVGASYAAGAAYAPDTNIIAKVTVRGAVPFMSAFEVGTNFWNPRALVETHYLTWGYNTLEHLKGKPWITLEAA